MDLPWPSPLRREDRWLERARSGDRGAFVRLYRSLYPPLYRFVARRVARPEDAEDVVGRLFEMLVARLDTVDTARGHVRTFLLAAARNALVDAARARREALDLEAAEPNLLELRTPLDRVLEHERAAALRARVAALGAEEQRLLGLRYGDGLGHREIAALLGLSPAAVRQRLSRTVRSLREPSPLEHGALAHDA
ncbi:MAG TPA: sigma-70 family RNA polymerase sigma factor [Myxococcaceae bacterium]|jgi:RNA polymerase sigma-70 factor (ECF subfamily)|nr:sigma-70 family RNA polymerase sigma factor [Myxococcaceae bacterium]